LLACRTKAARRLFKHLRFRELVWGSAKSCVDCGRHLVCKRTLLTTDGDTARDNLQFRVMPVGIPLTRGKAASQRRSLSKPHRGCGVKAVSRGMVLHLAGGAPTLAGGDSAYRRSLYRGFWDLMVHLFRKLVLQIRRCASAFPLTICFDIFENGATTI
jgi:hypothetical protein